MSTYSCVRQAVLVATTTVFLVVPAHVLMSDMASEITETKAWLEDVMEHDPDTECQKLSAQALMLLQGQIKKEIQSSIS
ncbi:telomere length regulation protein TEL2 [Elysia marginata]|uniref:Telomere length regulation protein TEL2 n=1 Tax=Elysia marginata TaxID=1093978 RepID=A0AAV4JD47_9GAST|nr:telomere length regulation protein TEL2 [Elysia marginata]